MSNVLAFLEAIAEHPADDTLRLVFADWLEEQGDCRAEFLRLDCTIHATARVTTDAAARARWRELRSRLSPSWLAVLGRARLENCKPRFRRPCPEKWERLRPTELAAVRFCNSCYRSVHYCGTIDEARQHTEAGRCVAVDSGVLRCPGDLSGEFDLVLGEMDLDTFAPE